MKQWNMLVGNVSIKQQQKKVQIYIKDLFIKESNILADNVIIKQLQKEVWI